MSLESLLWLIDPTVARTQRSDALSRFLEDLSQYVYGTENTRL